VGPHGAPARRQFRYSSLVLFDVPIVWSVSGRRICFSILIRERATFVSDLENRIWPEGGRGALLFVRFRFLVARAKRPESHRIGGRRPSRFLGKSKRYGPSVYELRSVQQRFYKGEGLEGFAGVRTLGARTRFAFVTPNVPRRRSNGPAIFETDKREYRTYRRIQRTGFVTIRARERRQCIAFRTENASCPVWR